MIRNPFLFGFQASTGLGENDARDAWLEFSKDLSERARLSIEAFGYLEGHHQGKQYLRIHLYSLETERHEMSTTISELDSQIKDRWNAGNKRFAVAKGDARSYQSEVISTHRSFNAAQRSAKKNEAAIWQWDSYLNPNGGYR